jgi:GntR family transcriptional regulator|nr:GntR family transcriptional regulator [Aeromicrobium sp.]
MAMRAESSYRLVARELRAQILQGVFSDGQRLPTEAELSADYAVSRQTIRRAFQDLVSEGMVYRIPGRGTFAQPASDGYIRQVGSVDDLMGLSDDTGMEILEPLARRVDLISAGRLRLSSDAVFRLKFARTHDGTRFCVTTVSLPPQVGRELSNVPELTTVGAQSEVTVIGLIDARLRDPIAEAQQSITVEVAGEAESAYLHCDAGHPLLRVDRLYLDTTGQAVELATSHFLPEHYSYRISLRRNS